ncbi:MAG: pyrroloquinoline quinone biosynthesis peptide chaperone PqqD [Rhodomicrobium sp.]
MIRERAIVSPASKPHFPKYVRMQFDNVRKQFAVLGPERVYWPDDVSVDILKLCDGQRSISDIAGQLAQTYAAPVETIQADVLEFIQSWTDLHLLKPSEI